MEKINAVITGVGGYVPDYVLSLIHIYMVLTPEDPLFLWYKGQVVQGTDVYKRQQHGYACQCHYIVF